MLKLVERASPLAHVVRQGRFGADRGAVGVSLSVRHPASIVIIIARKDKAEAASKAIAARFGAGLPAAGKSSAGGGASFHWCGADQWYAIADGFGEGELYRALRETLAGLASVSDQSHGRVIMRVAGPKARAVLAKGTPVDVHESVFATGSSAVTQMAHVGVHLVRTGDDAFELSVFRGFSANFWDWLTTMAEEFGYQVG
ncbi:MAG: sarcosine oxidase subunit gamma [Rhizobiales bacterium]|nr:sarcosine oxidase subunit gamma [Hyphomicrobiales bacterium]